jgi:GNAT superfamily N-acetyltransferase
MIIRPMQQSDIPQCLIIAREGWDRGTAQHAAPDFTEMFASAAWRPFFYVAEEHESIVGMVGYGVSWLCYGVYNLFWLAVRRNARGRGIGKALIERCLDDLYPIADVLMLVTSIPEFYERHWRFRTIANIKTTENYGEHLMLLTVDHPKE